MVEHVCPCVVPSTIEFKCGLHLAALAKNGELFDKKGEALQHAGCLLLSIGGALIDSDVPDLPIVGSSSCPYDEDSIDSVAQYVSENAVQAHRQALSVSGANPWLVKAMFKLARMVMDELESSMT